MKTVINIKADRAIKIGAQKIASELGLSLSAIVNAYLRQLIKTKSVYFSASSKMSPGLEKLLGVVEKDIKRNKNISRSFSSMEELTAHLDNL